MITIILSKLLLDTDIIVKPTDINLGIAIIPRIWYEKQALDTLNNAERVDYKIINELPTYEDVFQKFILQLRENKINFDIYIYLISTPNNNSKVNYVQIYQLPRCINYLKYQYNASISSVNDI